MSSFSHDMTVEKSSLYVEKVQHFIVFTAPTNADRYILGLRLICFSLTN